MVRSTQERIGGYKQSCILAYEGYELPQILTLVRGLGTNLPKTLRMTIFNDE